jgi:hypothetical protein
MAVLIDAVGGSTERAFKSETVNEVELSPHHDSGSRFSCFLDYEVAVLKAEMLCIATE